METNQVMLAAGGDSRQSYAARNLADLPGWIVETVGVAQVCHREKIRQCADDLHDVLPYDVLVLPVPASIDGVTVPTASGKSEIMLEQLLAYGKPGALVLGGQCSEKLKQRITAAGMQIEDYFRREELCLGNAVPTAEGAIQIAMEETDTTLHGGHALIIGYGRIGIALGSRLRALGMTVTVCARRCETRALAQMQGFASVSMDDLADAAAKADLILNTVPALVLTETILRKLQPQSLVIDLASRPGGTDFETARQLGTHIVWALSLPPDRMR